MKIIYLGLGTNQGSLRSNLIKALDLLKYSNIKIVKVSPVYETEPIGYKEQPYFNNICVQAETNLNPHELLFLIKSIESQMGRKKAVKNGPRIIDIDILFYSNIIIKDKDLIIPHPEIIKRKFVLEPLCQIAPELVHPELNGKIAAILKENTFSGEVRCLGEL